MKTWDRDVEITYELFHKICEWGARKGFNDIAAMKDLVRRAMINVYLEKHQNKPPSKAKIAAAVDLGVSIRNIEKCIKESEKLNDVNPGFISLRHLFYKVIALLFEEPQPYSFTRLLSELSHLIQAPYDKQRAELASFLRDLELAGFISSKSVRGETYYYLTTDSVNFSSSYTDRLSGLLLSLEAYEDTITEPFFRVYNLNYTQAKIVRQQLWSNMNENTVEKELECRQTCTDIYSHRLFYGFGLWGKDRAPSSTADAFLRIVRQRFGDPASIGIAGTIAFDLTPEWAQAAFKETVKFVEQECCVRQAKSQKGSKPYVLVLGMTGPAVQP